MYLHLGFVVQTANEYRIGLYFRLLRNQRIGQFIFFLFIFFLIIFFYFFKR